MLLNFCLGCKKKKMGASLSDDRLDSVESVCLPKTPSNNNFKTSNSRTSSKSPLTNKFSTNKTPPKSTTKSDQVDGQLTATSPVSICKFSESLSTPVHSINTDGSIRIKANAINRALPDIPINDLVSSSINTSINSTASAILNRSTDRSLTPTNSFVLNQTETTPCCSSQSSSIKYNCNSTSTFNPPIANVQNSSNVTSNLLLDTQNLNNDHDELNNKSDRHHSYARIKDNVVIDSSTENDTDDYYDSAVLTKRGLDSQKVTINVPSANVTNDQSNETGTSLYYAVSDNLQNSNRITNLELPYHISNINTIPNNHLNSSHLNTSFINSNNHFSSPISNNFSSNTNPINIYDLSTDEETAKKVSYNKISVREPLAKVLADRAALIEHHYTEVYDENNSFYEEIAGSTNSSVTYTKIGDLMSANSNQLNHHRVSSPSDTSLLQASNSSGSSNQLLTTNLVSNSNIQSPVETSLLTIKHSSRSTSPNLQNVLPILQTFQPNNNTNSFNVSSTFTHQQQQPPINFEALYTQINKLTKTNKKSLHIPQTSNQQLPINTNDLYAKVQKNLKIKSQNESSSFMESGATQRKIHSSTPDMNHMNPPPVPSIDKIPKNPKTNHLFTIKSNTNLNHQSNDVAASTSGFNQYNLNVYPQHKRSFSSSSQYQDNISDSDYYETFPKNSDNHSYETVKKSIDNKLNDEDKEIIDAGYEIISYSNNKKDENNSDEDSPCYETIAPNKKNSDENDENEYVSEPDYEVIKTTGANNNKVSSFRDDNFSKLSRKESDVSTTDPGYEQLIDYTNSKKQKIEEDYEVVSNDPNHFIERL